MSKKPTKGKSLSKVTGSSRRAKATIEKLKPATKRAARRGKSDIKDTLTHMGLFSKLRDPARTVEIPTGVVGLSVLMLSPQEFETIQEVTQAEANRLLTSGEGFGMRYRIEIAAMFLASLISQSHNAATASASKAVGPLVLSDAMVELAVARARELFALYG